MLAKLLKEKQIYKAVLLYGKYIILYIFIDLHDNYGLKRKKNKYLHPREGPCSFALSSSLDSSSVEGQLLHGYVVRKPVEDGIVG